MISHLLWDSVIIAVAIIGPIVKRCIAMSAGEQVGKGYRLSERAKAIDDEVFKIALGLPPDVLSLTAGEPDFPSSEFVKEAAIKAIREEKTHYTSPAGIKPLREAIADKLNKENNAPYSWDEILVAPGSASAIYLLLHALADIGDEVLIPDPAWFHYPILSGLAGLKPVRIPLSKENGFKIDGEEMEKRITDRTRVLILNSPSNPTGKVISKEELEEIAGVAERKNLTVISDEIYEKIVYAPHEHISIASISGMKERTIIINGMSKGYAMTGWRIGYAASSPELTLKMTSLMGYSLVCASSVSQYAAIEALRNPESRKYAEEMVRAWTRRREIVLKAVRENSDVLSTMEPQGTFYGWLDISGSGMSGKEVSSGLLSESNTAVFPGSLFGKNGEKYVRISFATSDDIVEKGMEKLCEFLHEHNRSR